MIDYHFETDFTLKNEAKFTDWITRIIRSEKYSLGTINFIFCKDDYLLKVNQQYLNHDTFTDIITFDYTKGKEVSGDIFISVDRVNENAIKFKVPFEEELLRVMAHGVLHLMGFNDKSEDDIVIMREKENEKMKLFHVEH
ncbi:rRNA maturation RNase YbeY [Costertonia aggregata]|uniref:Endoribonuclease YbeY n=1 Tax=Costertonia aggregata TaxID=343403 RepID=A0A7H9APB4_9FLAO|nr:rRNA maturation RNase YbeY [Costertonia aggregata]QLG45272.1 rRNA maturation RNase YbeY [Costertonia aggregata]